MVMIAEPYQTDLINLTHWDSYKAKLFYPYSIPQALYPLFKELHNGEIASRHYLQSFIIEIVHFSISLL